VEMAIEQSDAKTTRDAVAEIQHLSNSAPEQLHVTGVIPQRHNRALSYTESLLLQYYLDCSNRWITASRLRDAELADANNNKEGADKLASF
jgi:uncharacterized protein with PIN domain